MANEERSIKQKLTVKDLITVGVFSAIIFVCIALSGGMLAMFPALTFYYPVGGALLAGPVYLLMVAKVPKSGPIFISGLLMAIFCFVTGISEWQSAICLVECWRSWSHGRSGTVA